MHIYHTEPGSLQTIPITYPQNTTCSGSTSECANCPMLTSFQTSSSANSLVAGTNLVIPILNITTGKLDIFANTSQGLSYSFYLAANKAEESFTQFFSGQILISVGAAFNYPGCLPWCLYDHTTTNPSSLINQKPGRVYNVTGTCYKALSNCDGCLNDPASYPLKLK